MNSDFTFDINNFERQVLQAISDIEEGEVECLNEFYQPLQKHEPAERMSISVGSVECVSLCAESFHVEGQGTIDNIEGDIIFFKDSPKTQIYSPSVISNLSSIEKEEIRLVTDEIAEAIYSSGVENKELLSGKMYKIIKKNILHKDPATVIANDKVIIFWKILVEEDILPHICPFLKSLSNDVNEVAKALMTALVPLVLSGTIPIPLNPILFAMLALIVCKAGIHTICPDNEKKEKKN